VLFGENYEKGEEKERRQCEKRRKTIAKGNMKLKM
jgi:hypothetical protein